MSPAIASAAAMVRVAGAAGGGKVKHAVRSSSRQAGMQAEASGGCRRQVVPRETHRPLPSVLPSFVPPPGLQRHPHNKGKHTNIYAQ